jgi:hypothetical protein
MSEEVCRGNEKIFYVYNFSRGIRLLSGIDDDHAN